jgi:metal-sulfur cluster biosynthetic enzyme
MAAQNPSMLTEAQILDALRDCYDPEFKLNVVELGLIDSIATGPDPDSTPAWPRQWVKVIMTLTAPESAAAGLILEQVNNRLAGIQHISKVDVELIWEPKWTPERISAAGRKQLEIEKELALREKKKEKLVQISPKTGESSS